MSCGLYGHALSIVALMMQNRLQDGKKKMVFTRLGRVKGFLCFCVHFAFACFLSMIRLRNRACIHFKHGARSARHSPWAYLLSVGMLLLDEDETEDAIAMLDDTPTEGLRRDVVIVGLATACVEVLEHEKALPIYRKLTSLLHGKLSARRLSDVARGFYTLGCYDEARAWSLRAVVKNPASVNALYGLAASYYCLGRMEDALRASDNVLRTKSRYVRALDLKGNTLARMGRYSEAIVTLRTVAEKDPRRADIWSNLGWALLLMGDYHEAKEALEKAIDLGDCSIETQHNLRIAKVEVQRHGNDREPGSEEKE